MAKNDKKSPVDMSQDLLMKEVDEEVRAERLQGWWNSFGNWVIGGAVLIVLATIGYEFLSSRTQQANEATTAALIQAHKLTEQGQHADALTLLSAQKQASGVQLLATLQHAQLLLDQGDIDTAKALYSKVASAQRRQYPALADYAALYSSQTATPRAGEPFYTLAQELKALALIEVGDKKAANELISAILPDPSIPAAQRLRLEMIQRSVSE